MFKLNKIHDKFGFPFPSLHVETNLGLQKRSLFISSPLDVEEIGNGVIIHTMRHVNLLLKHRHSHYNGLKHSARSFISPAALHECLSDYNVSARDTVLNSLMSKPFMNFSSEYTKLSCGLQIVLGVT